MISKKKNPRVSRRALLGSMGAAGVLAPFIPMLQRETEAAPGDFPLRIIFLFSANGTLHENWVPSGSENDFTLSEILTPLAPYQDQMIVLDGLEVVREGPGDGHQMGMGLLWTGSRLLEGTEFEGGGDSGTAGWGGGISVDQHIAAAVGNDNPYSSLEFGVQTQGASVWSRMCYAGSNQPIAPEDDPAGMFNRLFADFDVDASELERLKGQRQSVIDLVKDDLDSLMVHHGSADDRLKIDAHLEAIRSIEQRNQAEQPVCEIPVEPGEMDAGANDNFPSISERQTQLMAMSLACDMTRVASMQWSASVSNRRFTWLGIEEGHHDLSHRGDSDPVMVDNITAINVWYAEQVKELMDALAGISEGDGSVLDNTLLVWGNELSRGNSHGNHPVPFVLLGGAGGRLEMGRYLQYDRVPHNRLLVSLCHAMGLTEQQTFGDIDVGSGGLPGLT
ncbi:MAG: DUF1552 domain-containing protein [Deltaproteobacteria bacterium]|nr:DUF1552 domain-containing protein [Deltaproteobacteria bacterium]